MIRTVLRKNDTGELKFGGAELEDEWRSQADSTIWLDLETESKAESQALFDRFKLHQLAVDDALRTRHPPKFEAFSNHLFLLLRGLDAETTSVDFGVIQLSIFVGEGFIITRHVKPSVSANACFDQLKKGNDLLADGGAAFATRLWNRIARRYIQILLDLEPRLDEIEGEVFDNPDDRLLAELTSYKSKLRQIGRIARYHEHVLNALAKDDSGRIPQTLEHELNDLREQIERTASLATLYYEVACDLTDGYLAFSTHRLNGVMRVLTIITVLFVPLTFVAGIYGMNFENMPELTSRVGYFVVIGAMVVIALVQLIFFRRKGWL